MNALDAPTPARLEARIDLDALRSNVRRLRELTSPAQVMAVVKADAYGHGMIPCARAALEAGATWIGTAVPEEALALRADGIEAPILTWLHAPGDDFESLVLAGIDVSVSGQWTLHAIREAVERTGEPARIQLKADTGLGRNGVQPLDWPLVVDEAVKAERDGLLRITGIWSHFACADEPGHPSINRQLTAFHEALEYAEAAGVRPEVRHLANSAATLSVPDSRFDLVRTGAAMYGLSPAPELGVPADHGLRPVMSLVARLASVKRAPAGHGVSYGHTYHTSEETRLALVPAGYADGIPRAASGLGPVSIGGRRHTVAGRVAMDQFVVDLGPCAESESPSTRAHSVQPEPRVGDEAVLFGPGDDGTPTAQDWAEAADTIGYEIVTRIGPRVPRVYSGVSNTSVAGRQVGHSLAPSA